MQLASRDLCMNYVNIVEIIIQLRALCASISEKWKNENETFGVWTQSNYLHLDQIYFSTKNSKQKDASLALVRKISPFLSSKKSVLFQGKFYQHQQTIGMNLETSNFYCMNFKYLLDMGLFSFFIFIHDKRLDSDLFESAWGFGWDMIWYIVIGWLTVTVK